MRKIVILILGVMNLVTLFTFITLEAKNDIPTYTIIANSNAEKDIEEMYTMKDTLIADYKEWAKGVDDTYQVLADHTKVHNATFYNGEYKIVLGEGKGKTLTGKLQSSYCTSSKDIEKKSWLEELFS